MKVLVINGSPHEKGCTYMGLRECMAALHQNGVETELINLGDHSVRGCSGCWHCAVSGRCIHDDICNVIIDKMQQADGMLVGSPVYFAGPSALLCAVLERVFAAGGASFKGKAGAAMVSCRRSGSTAAFDRLNKFFTYSKMPVATSQNCWNGIHGQTPAEVLQDEEGLQTMRVLGANMAWLIKSIQSAGLAMPPDEESIETSFIR